MNFTKNKGFTLIELLVVMVILSLLVAVAMPNFLGAQQKGDESIITQEIMGVARVAKAANLSADPGSFVSTADSLQKITADNQGRPINALTSYPSQAAIDAAYTANAKTISIYVTNAGGSLFVYRKTKSGQYCRLAMTSMGRYYPSTGVACTPTFQVFGV